MKVTARLLAGEPLALRDDDGMTALCTLALERVGEDLHGIGDMALKARTAGGAA